MIVDIPPAWVVRAARARLNAPNGNWEDYYAVLCAWYSVPTLKAKVNPAISPNTIAQYTYGTNLVESRAKTFRESTALHEFFHYMVDQTRRTHYGEAEQALADSFAEECLKRVWVSA